MTSALIVSDEVMDLAARLLLPTDVEILRAYRDGGKRLAPSTSAGMFDLFLQGNTLTEIFRLNKAFPYGAILWSYVEEKWEDKKARYIEDLHEATKNKLMKATIDTTGLLADVLSAAALKHGSKLRKYIQTGNVADLGDAMTADSITAIVKAVDGLQKLTGQDKIMKIKQESVVTGSIALTRDVPEMTGKEAAAFLMSPVAKEKKDEGT